jgi:tape measure domain-containing protein
MVGLDYVINLMDKSFSGGMKAAKKNTEGLDNAVGKTNKGIDGLAGSSKKGFGSIVTWAKRAAVATGLVFAIGQVSAFGTEITNQAAKFEGYENAIKFASGAEGATNIQFLDKTIKDLNLDLTSSYGGFQTLSGSLKGTTLEGKATRDIFEAVGIAATTMNLTADQSKGAFLALGQMASKGKVQAEELRGQLGERIPGALGIAARAMGVNQVQFNKMLDTGKVYAEDFLPKFAKELKKTFEGGLPAAANSMQAAINKKNNALVSFKKSFGDNMKPAIVGILNLKTQFFGFLEAFLPRLNPILSSVVNLAKAFKPLTDRLFGLGSAMGGTEGFANGLKTAIDSIAIGVEIAAEGLGFVLDILQPFAPIIIGIVAAQWAWNIAMTANPIGLVVAGIALLAGGLIYAYKKVGWFRGAIMAIWETMKGFGNAIKIFVVDRIKQMLQGITGIGGALMSFFKGDWKKAWEQGTAAVKNLTGLGVGNGKKLIDNMKSTGLNAGKAYANGLKQAKDNNKKEDNIFDVTSKKGTSSIKGTATANSNANAVVGGNTNTKKQTLSGSVSGGTASKNITFNIGSLVKELKIQPQTLKEGFIDVEKQVKDIFIRLMRDVETQTS